MSDAEQQSDLLHAKDQQQLAADQQVLRHMLSRVSTRGLQRQHVYTHVTVVALSTTHW